MTLTQKGTRAATATAEDVLQSNPKSAASGKEEKEDDEISESKERDKAIAEWIGRPLKPPSSNKDKEDEDEEKDVGAPLASTENGSPGDKDDEGREDDQRQNGIYEREDTLLYNAEDNEEEASLGHKGADSSKRSEDKDEDDDVTSDKDINCDGNSDGGGDRNNGTGGGSAEWLRFL